MRHQLLSSLLVTLVMTCTSSYAQDAKNEVRRAIMDAVEGKCSDVLSTMVKYACDQQMPQAAPMYKAMGELQELSFMGHETFPVGRAEVYLAKHTKGKMLWAAIKAPDGKLSTFWSPGPAQ